MGNYFVDVFDWYFRLSFSRKAAVDAAIKVLLGAKFGGPADCLMTIYVAKTGGQSTSK